MPHAPAVLLVVALALIGRTWLVAPLEPDEPSADPTPSADAVVRTTVEASVTRVIDGSSLDAYLLGRRTAVGYLGVETPSLNRPCGAQALARNRELAGSTVLLEEDSSYQLDAIGRRLYYTYTADGMSIDDVLVGEGLARAVRTDGVRGARLAALQAEAEASGRGCLWSGGGP